MELNLQKLGVHSSQMPQSLATCFDFVSIWGSDPNRAQLGRLCAAAIGVAIDHTSRLPKYNVSKGDVLGYGHTCMDRLLKAGVTPAQMFEMGTQILAEMTGQINFGEVEQTANFTHPTGEGGIS